MDGRDAALNAWLQRLEPDRRAAVQAACDAGWREVSARFGDALSAAQPCLTAQPWRLNIGGDGVLHLHSAAAPDTLRALAKALQLLKPWRKGPIVFHGRDDAFTIDAEWQSHWKWQRLVGFLPEIRDRVVLDIGANNGFYSYHLAEYRPSALVSIDPTSLYAAQCAALYAASTPPGASFAPVGLDVLHHAPASVDVLLLMGILYHHSDPVGVLRLCRDALTKGGDLLIETIVIEGEGDVALFPSGRYAGARGFYFLPTLRCLESWIRRSGLRVHTMSAPAFTTPEEQRSTAWRDGPSLAEGLHPDDASRTIEGHPAPQRVILRCGR